MSNLLVQNIKHTNNTTSMSIDTSGQVTIRGEGSATTTNLQQGLAKVWAGTVSDSASATDSFGLSSIEDTGTGDNRINYTNSFANVGYAAVTGTGNTGGSEPDRVIFCALMETGTLRMQTMIANTGADSGIDQHIQLCGDLA
tara:strand:+ start:153 stop:578 length:426 start_codon:yes stop_codon:yes gene_type:complete